MGNLDPLKTSHLHVTILFIFSLLMIVFQSQAEQFNRKLFSYVCQLALYRLLDSFPSNHI